MLSKLGSCLLVLLFLSLAQLAQSIPLYSPDRVSFQFEPKFYSTLHKSNDGSIGFPTGNKELDGFMSAYDVEKLVPVFSHDPISMSDPIFFRLGMERDYRLITKRFPTGLDPVALADELQKLPIIVFAEPVCRSDCDYTPNDWALSGMNSWGIDSCHARQAWEIQRGDSTVLAATIDTGVDFNHPDLWPNIAVNPAEDVNHDGRFTSTDNDGTDADNNGFIDDVIGWNFVSHSYNNLNGFPAVGEQYGTPNNNPFDVHGHGTHVCGSIAARTNNGIGVTAASFNVKTICIRAGFAWLDSNGTIYGSGYDDDFEQAIQYAVNRGVRIISISFGGSGSSSIYQTAINYAHDHGCLLFAAAGNNNTSEPSYPAAYDSVIAVAALSTGNVRASFSNYGTWVDISAPGVNIWSTMVNNVYHNYDYAAWSGTSMATPTAASVAALVLSRRPNMSGDTLKAILLRSAKNINAQNSNYIGLLGRGLINADSAVRSVSIAPVSLNIPNGGENWTLGSTRTIQWSTSGSITTVHIELNRAYPSSSWETIASSAPNTGNYSWTVSGSTSFNARIRVSNTANSSQADTSNGNFTILVPAYFSISPVSESVTLYSGDTLNQTMTLHNTGGMTMNAAVQDTGWNYTFARSTDIGGPVFNWIDASSGTAGPTGDDATNGPFTLPFSFPFFGHSYTNAWMCTNGWISFDSTASTAYGNDPLPTNQLNAMIAAYWGDLNVAGEGTTRFLADNVNHRATFAWSSVQYIDNSASVFNFEIVLSQTGSVLLQYGVMSLAGSSPSNTVGIQNTTRLRWQQTGYDTTIASNSAVLFTPNEPWVKWSPLTFSIPGGGIAPLTLTFDARTRSAGSILNTILHFQSNATNASVTVPLQMMVLDHAAPATPVIVNTVESGDTVRLTWNAVRYDYLGQLLASPPIYRIEENNSNPLGTVDTWSPIMYQNDTARVILLSGVTKSYFRVVAEILSSSDRIHRGAIYPAYLNATGVLVLPPQTRQ